MSTNDNNPIVSLRAIHLQRIGPCCSVSHSNVVMRATFCDGTTRLFWRHLGDITILASALDSMHDNNPSVNVSLFSSLWFEWRIEARAARMLKRANSSLDAIATKAIQDTRVRRVLHRFVGPLFETVRGPVPRWAFASTRRSQKMRAEMYLLQELGMQEREHQACQGFSSTVPRIPDGSYTPPQHEPESAQNARFVSSLVDFMRLRRTDENSRKVAHIAAYPCKTLNSAVTQSSHPFSSSFHESSASCSQFEDYSPSSIKIVSSVTSFKSSSTGISLKEEVEQRRVSTSQSDLLAFMQEQSIVQSILEGQGDEEHGLDAGFMRGPD
ncbi:hypothetical protein BC830DRAFT_274908 [Chytriomyces sp. MP71]|nr:hypothetical protein BC830DRAFT_274908 [Chytriomyces sp. MP71]